MHKLGGILLIAALTLTGCASAAQPEAGKQPAAEESSSPPALVAEEPANAIEDEFYTATKRIPGLENVAFEDALEVGEYVCSELDAGVSPLDIVAVKNTDTQNNQDMIAVSTLTLCTEHEAAMQEAFNG